LTVAVAEGWRRIGWGLGSSHFSLFLLSFDFIKTCHLGISWDNSSQESRQAWNMNCRRWTIPMHHERDYCWEIGYSNMKCSSNTRVSHQKINILSTDLVFIIFGEISFKFCRILNILYHMHKICSSDVNQSTTCFGSSQFLSSGSPLSKIIVHSMWSIAQ